jgi:histidyl-tRNA synthetase
MMGEEAEVFSRTITQFRNVCLNEGYSEVIIPSLWEQETFVKKAGPEIMGQMYSFKDKGDRDICLIPEVTAIIEEMWTTSWSKSMPRPLRLFYVNRCYRYDRPQAGRYREFTQFGVELLGNKEGDREEVTQVLRSCLATAGIDWNFVESVKRGLNYYVEDGFEAECEKLGAQKQIAGGGRYKSGIGFAIGVDRVILGKRT